MFLARSGTPEAISFAGSLHFLLVLFRDRLFEAMIENWVKASREWISSKHAQLMDKTMDSAWSSLQYACY